MMKSLTKILAVSAAQVAVLAAVSIPAAAADAKNGADLFDNYCADCHTVKEGVASRKGPNLFGVVGRKTGSATDFEYSDANKAAGWVWSAELLDRYLTNPRAAIPGTIMKFKGDADAGERADLIAYLATLHK